MNRDDRELRFQAHESIHSVTSSDGSDGNGGGGGAPSADGQKLSPMLRSLLILERVCESQSAVSGAELVKLLGVPKQTVHRIARQLEIEGFLQREFETKRYVPGPRLRDMAVNIHLNSVAAGPRHAILQSLSDEIGETCNCTIVDRNELVYFDRVEANWPHRIQLPVGSRHPLHCTASGKLLLAFMPARQRRQLVSAAPLKRHTEKTITDVDQLNQELKRIRSTAVGEDNEEYLPGMVAMAVPVFDESNRVGISLAVHAPTIRKPIEELRQYLPAMRRAAAAIGAAAPTIEE